MSTRVIIIVNWTLSYDSIIHAWIPKDLHISQPYTKIKSCYTGRTTGEIIGNRLEVLYEYKLQVTNLIKIKEEDCNNCDNCDVYWQGYYNNHLVAFDFSTRNKNLKYNIQTIQEIDGIVRASSMSKLTPIVDNDTDTISNITTTSTTTSTTTTTTTSTTTTTTTSDNISKNHKHHYHKFKLSESIVLCEQCGYTPEELVKTIGYDVDGRLPSCTG